MVSDSCLTYSNPIHVTLRDNNLKIFTDGEALYGASGDMDRCQAFARWVLVDTFDPAKFPAADKEHYWEGFRIEDNETIECWNEYAEPHVHKPEGGFAWGSGVHLCLGAFAAGANAIEACAISCDLDPFSKLPLQVLTLDDLGNEPREPYKINKHDLDKHQGTLYNHKLTSARLHKFLRNN